MPASAENVWVVDGAFDVAALAGKVVYWFDLGPVLHRCGRGSPARLRLMCEQHVVRLVPDEFVIFQPAGFFLVVRSCAGAQAASIAQSVNAALLKLFFGTDAAEKIGPLFRIAEASEIGLPRSATAPTPDSASKSAPQAGAQADPDPLARLAANGQPGYDGLRVGFLPVFDLQRGTASTFLCTPVRDGRQATLGGIDPRDRPSLDEAMLEQSLLLTREIAARRLTAAAATPVSFETLASPRSRRLYQFALRSADAAENPFLVVKIEGVPPGTPAARLAEIVATIRTDARRVFVQVPSSDARLTDGGRFGATGLFARLPEDAAPAPVAALAKALIWSAQAQRACTYVEGVDSAWALGLVRAAGVRLASGRALGRGLIHSSVSDVLLSLDNASSKAA